MAFTITVNNDDNHTLTFSKNTLARRNEANVSVTVVVPAAVFALGSFAYVDFILPDGSTYFKGDYDPSGGSFTFTLGSADTILSQDGRIGIQFVLRDSDVLPTVVWKSELKYALVGGSADATAQALIGIPAPATFPATFPAANTSIVDAGTYFASPDVEDALQEIGADIVTNTANIATNTTDIDALELRELFDHKQMRNLIVNGDFSSGVFYWVGQGATIGAAGNTLSVTGDGSSANVGTTQTGIGTRNGNKWYTKTKLRVTNALATKIEVYPEGTLLGHSISSPTLNTWYTQSSVLTLANTGVGATFLSRAVYADAATANGKVMQVQYVLAIDLTAHFGAGNEPTAAQMDAYLATYPNSWFGGLADTGIVESRSNANGSYIKFADGTMICYKTVVYESVAITSAIGSLFISGSLTIGAWPALFNAIPIASLHAYTISGLAIATTQTKQTISSGQVFRVIYPTSTTAQVVSEVVAIGRWKA